jgi:YcxB-like protein
MDEKIEVTIQYTVDDYSRSLAYIQNRQFITVSFVMPLIIVPAMVFVFLMRNQNKNMGTKETLIAIFVGLFIGVIVSISLSLLRKYDPIRRWRLQKQINWSPALKEIKVLTLDEEGIKGSQNLGSGQTKWEAFIEATETKEDFFFFTSSKFAQFIPKYAFNETQLNQLRELVKSKLGDKAKF